MATIIHVPSMTLFMPLFFLVLVLCSSKTSPHLVTIGLGRPSRCANPGCSTFPLPHTQDMRHRHHCSPHRPSPTSPALHCLLPRWRPDRQTQPGSMTGSPTTPHRRTELCVGCSLQNRKAGLFLLIFVCVCLVLVFIIKPPFPSIPRGTFFFCIGYSPAPMG